MFVNLPTGYGKSLIYQALPFIFDITRGIPGHIVIVVSPLTNLMKDQVSILNRSGIPAVSLSNITAEDANSVEQGHFRVVYGSPECWLEKVLEESVF